MTKRENYNEDLVRLGKEIKEARMNLSLGSRESFIRDRENNFLIEFNSISVKTLTNIENGHNLPSLSTLKLLIVALEVDREEFIKKIWDYIPT